ncbi:MAG: ArsR family transcriptional regulator [Candidatus Aenigmatarchaeota archaeon]
MELIFKSKEVNERAIYADLDFICSNLTRVAILYLLIKSSITDHSLSVERISYHLGKNHRVVLHHLEKLKEYGIVNVVKTSKNGKRRKIWGLVKEKIDLIKEIYLYATRNFFTQAQLEKACNINKKVR